MPEYMSPTSLKIWETDRTAYYLQYLADNKPPRVPQTVPMSIGSSFDAYAKSWIYNALFGKRDPRFEFQAIFEAQVEPQNRDYALEAGRYCFEMYKLSGALTDLMTELGGAVGEPRFEFAIKGVMGGQREGIGENMSGVPLLGKPDIFFINSQAAHVTYDWKVNGFMATRITSPKQGYVKCRDSWTTQDNKGWGMDGRFFPPSKNSGPHKDAQLLTWKGITINAACYLEQTDKGWADQLATYSWLLGETIGSECLIGIDQLCGVPQLDLKYPLIRVASHRTRISEEYQRQVLQRYMNAWAIIQSGYIFRDLSFEDSRKQQEMLDKNEMNGDSFDQLTRLGVD